MPDAPEIAQAEMRRLRDDDDLHVSRRPVAQEFFNPASVVC